MMMLFETVTERKSIVAMFHAASQIADNNRNDPFANGYV